MKRPASLALVLMGLAAIAAGPAADPAGALRVGALTYGDGARTKCFSDAFLAEADRASTLHVDRKLHDVGAGSESLFEYPMVVMSGKGALSLTDAQASNLRAYLQRGGFVLAGPRCADKPWDEGFRRLVAQLLPDAKLEPLAPDHALMRTLFRIDRVETAWPTPQPLWGLAIDGRLGVVYSPAGLNDSADLGAECCCCGTNEVTNARQINANALVYAVTR